MSSKTTEIAVVGLSCNVAGAKNRHEFWQNLIKGVSLVKKQRLPKNSWAEDYYSGLLEDVDCFDNHFFSISEREARLMDPQQRLLLQETYTCIEDSGISLEKLQSTTTAVFVGNMTQDYQNLILTSDDRTDSYGFLGTNASILANRLSYHFNLKGLSIPVETASSSSLVAVHLAKESLRNNECDFAIVAGVSLNLHPWKMDCFDQSFMLSTTGGSRPFDSEGDGYAPGDGIVVMLLQRKHDAMINNNIIYGIIKGSAVNHGGKSISITSPNVVSQKSVINSSLTDACLSPELVSYIETHGSGTPLGDPIEYEALRQVYAVNSAKGGGCAIGSVKPNIGHLESASGIAGLAKVLLMMMNKTIPPTIHTTKLHPVIAFSEEVFLLNKEVIPWDLNENQEVRRAGVSSFGIGGVNAHVLVEEYDKMNLETIKVNKDQVFILSAKTEVSLNGLIEKWKKFIKTINFEDYSLDAICGTLTCGREHYEFKCGMIVSHLDDLPVLLKKIAYKNNDNKAISELYINKNNWNSWEQFMSFIEQNPFLKKSYTESVSEKSILKSEIKKISKKNTNQETSLFYFITNYIVLRALMVLGYKPDTIIGTGNDYILALVLAESISLEDAIPFVSDKKSLKEHLKLPSMTLINPEEKEQINPFILTKEYFNYMFEESIRDRNLLLELIRKTKLIAEKHDEFREILNEWKTTACKFNNEFNDVFNFDLPITQELKKVEWLNIALLSSVQTFYKKWGYNPVQNILNEFSEELLYFISSKLISKKQLAALFFASEQTSFEDIIHLNSDITVSEKLKNCVVLKFFNNKKFLELCSSGQLLDFSKDENKIATTKEQDKESNFDFNFSKKVLDTKKWFSRDEIFNSLVLNLWLKNQPIKWSLLYPSTSYNKVSLPSYCFSNNRFWIEKENIEFYNTTKESCSIPVINQDLVLDKSKEDLVNIETFLIKKISLLLQKNEKEIATDQILSNYGFDSILETKLKYEIEQELEILIPMLLLAEGITIEGLSVFIKEKLEEIPNKEFVLNKLLKDPESTLKITAESFFQGDVELDDLSEGQLDVLMEEISTKFPSVRNQYTF